MCYWCMNGWHKECSRRQSPCKCECPVEEVVFTPTVDKYRVLVFELFRLLDQMQDSSKFEGWVEHWAFIPECDKWESASLFNTEYSKYDKQRRTLPEEFKTFIESRFT